MTDMVQKEDKKKYVAIIILLFIYLSLPVFSMALIILLIYTLYQWVAIYPFITARRLIINILLTLVLISLTYGFRLLILWLRD